MRSKITLLLLLVSFTVFSQTTSDTSEIEATLNNYIDAFYKGDTTKLKAAIKPRLHKFGYWKNKATNAYEYYDHMDYKKAMTFVEKMKAEGKTRDETKIRKVEVLDIGNHIASAKVTAVWGIDYVHLSKDNGKWLIEQVIWEGPFDTAATSKTTYYLIRHAEKDRSDSSNKDPHLIEKGLLRAENWAKTFKNINFDAVYSTNYNRTKETALPTAKANNKELMFYDPRQLDIETFKAQTKGKTVLIVGHSNTTPFFANALLDQKKYEMIVDDNNGNLYIITLDGDSKDAMLLKIN